MTIKEVSEQYDISPDTLRYYERVGALPPVHRAPNGIRDYTDEDLRWVELAKCMRASGLPIEVLIEYLRLFRLGDESIPARLELLREQRSTLLEQRQRIDRMLDKLNYKIARYEAAVETGEFSW